MVSRPLTGISAGEVGVLWTTDLVIAATLLGAAALLVAGAWGVVVLRIRAMRTRDVGPVTELAARRRSIAPRLR